MRHRKAFAKHKVGICWRCKRRRVQVHYHGLARVFLCDDCRITVGVA